MAASRSSSLWGTAHGNAADGGRLVSSETKPSDELRPATPPDTDRRDHGPDGRFTVGNTVARSKRLRTGLQGALVALERKGDHAWQAAAKWGKRYGVHRRGELARAHGGSISAGVGALTEDEQQLRTDARYWRAKGMAEGNADYCKLAASLLAQARGAARDAWELAAREAAARPPEAGKLPPWLKEVTEPERESPAPTVSAEKDDDV